MNKYRLPKGHTSVLSPAFKYVPAAFTDLGKTFARIRGEHLQPQPVPGTDKRAPGSAASAPEFNIEVLEAAWLLRRPLW